MSVFRLKSYQHDFTAEQLADYRANRADGEELLQQLSAARPLRPDNAAQEREYLRLLMAISAQYRGRGLGWLGLLRVGHVSLVNYFARHPGIKDALHPS